MEGSNIEGFKNMVNFPAEPQQRTQPLISVPAILQQPFPAAPLPAPVKYPSPFVRPQESSATKAVNPDVGAIDFRAQIASDSYLANEQARKEETKRLERERKLEENRKPEAESEQMEKKRQEEVQTPVIPSPLADFLEVETKGSVRRSKFELNYTTMDETHWSCGKDFRVAYQRQIDSGAFADVFQVLPSRSSH